MAEDDDWGKSDPVVEGGEEWGADDKRATSSLGQQAWDVAKQIPSGVVAGVENIAAAPAQLLGLAGQGLDYIGLGGDPEAAAEQKKIRELAAEQRKGGIAQYLPTPETRAGRYARTAAEMVPAAVMQPGSIARRAAEGAAAGVASEGAGEVFEGTPLETSARVVGAVVGGYPVAKTAQISQDLRRLAGAPAETKLAAASNKAYTAARDMKVQYDPAATYALEKNIQWDLLGEGHRPGPGMSTFDRITELTAAPQTRNPTFSDIESVRKSLNKATGERTPNPPYGPTENAVAARRAIDHIDDFLADSTNAAQGWQGAAKRAALLAEEGRGNWAALKRSETIGNAQERGELGAFSTGSGANIDNRLRSEIRNILVNPRRARGFSAEDRVIMRDIVAGNPFRNSARLLGKMAATGIVSAAGIEYLASQMGLGAVGHLLLPAAGYAAKKTGDISTKFAYNKLRANLRSDSPLGKTMNVPAPGEAPSTGAALLRGASTGEGEGFKRGGAIKQAKEAVNYSKGMRTSRCGLCKFYVSGGACKKVQGRIDPNYWCKLFTKEKAT